MAARPRLKALSACSPAVNMGKTNEIISKYLA